MWRVLVVVVLACNGSPKAEAPPAAPPQPAAIVALHQTVDQLLKDSDGQSAQLEPAVAASKDAHTRPELEKARAAIDKLAADGAALEQRAAAAVAEASRLDREGTDRKETAYQRERVENLQKDLADRKKLLANATDAITASSNDLDRSDAKAKLEQLQHERDAALKAKHK